MLNARDLPHNEPIYTYIGSDGVNVHIASNRLRMWCLLMKPEIFYTPTDPMIAKKFLDTNAIDPVRALKMSRNKLREPILYCKDGKFTDGRPDVYLVDGHHRFFRAVMEGRQLIESWVLDYDIWQPFIVQGEKILTQEELKNLPITTRHY